MYYYPSGNGAYSQLQAQSQGLKGRPVSSLEEVRAAQIDFDGSLFIFPDLAHNRIYTKQISLDGNAFLNVYELSQLPKIEETSNFITREEFDETMGKLKDFLSQRKEEQLSKPSSEPIQFNF